MSKLGFGELELLIQKVIRDRRQATVRDVHESLGNNSSYTTIMTVMSRMAEKGELIREKEGKQYLYWLSPKNKAPTKSVLQRIQDKIFNGKSTAMISYLLESTQTISDEELAEIEKMIQKRRSEKNHG